MRGDCRSLHGKQHCRGSRRSRPADQVRRRRVPARLARRAPAAGFRLRDLAGPLEDERCLGERAQLPEPDRRNRVGPPHAAFSAAVAPPRLARSLLYELPFALSLLRKRLLELALRHRGPWRTRRCWLLQRPPVASALVSARGLALKPLLWFRLRRFCCSFCCSSTAVPYAATFCLLRLRCCGSAPRFGYLWDRWARQTHRSHQALLRRKRMSHEKQGLRRRRLRGKRRAVLKPRPRLQQRL